MFKTSQQAIDWLWQMRGSSNSPPLCQLQHLRTLIEHSQLKPTCPIITITGTNGKGSCVHLLTNILKHAHYRVGSFTSPHLQHYHERICVNGRSIDEAAFVAAANALLRSTDSLPQHFFSLLLLISLHFFQQQALDVLILEVGIGGRLDACNALDADIIGISRIALDHQALLGADRDSIGLEKAGLMRPGRTAVIGDDQIPDSVLQYGQGVGCTVRAIGQHFQSWHQGATHFQWQGSRWLLTDLPTPPILQSNTDTSLAILEALAERLPVSMPAIRTGLSTLSIKGRYQTVALGQHTLVLDVAHNPDAMSQLVMRLQRDWPNRPLHIIFGMMADKAWLECLHLLSQLKPCQIYPCPIDDPRALPLAELLDTCDARQLNHIACPSVADALQLAQTQAAPQSLIIVTGSFRLVGEALHWLDHQHPECLPSIGDQLAS